MTIRLSLSGLTLLSAVAFGSNAAADTLSLTHSVYLGGMYMGKLETDVTQTSTGYKIISTANSNRTLEWFFTWDADAATEGKIDGDTIRPVHHFYQSVWKDETRGAEISFKPGDVPDYTVTGKKSNNPKKYTPINDEALRGALDPLSVVVAASLKMERDGTCNSIYPVFDGRRHLNVTLTDIGVKTFNKSAYSVFSGDAKGCRITYEKLGGFKKKDDFKLDDDLDIYLASPVPGGRVVPVRMHVDTQLGGFELHLEKYRYQDVKLASRNAR